LFVLPLLIKLSIKLFIKALPDILLSFCYLVSLGNGILDPFWASYSDQVISE